MIGQPGGQPPIQGQQQGQKAQQGQPAQVFQRVVRPVQGQPGGQPAAGGGAGFANVQDLRNQRHEHTEPGGRVVIEEPDHRQIVREGGQAFIRHDENERLFEFGEGRHERRGDGDYAIIVRPDGDQIITVTDDDGRLIRRYRRDRDGHEFMFFDNRRPRGETILLNLPVPIIGIPQDQYIVDTAVAPEPFIYQTLMAPPLVPIERAYSLDEIRFNVALRDRMRRIDVDTITFDFGSWGVEPDQVQRLQLVAQAIQDIIARNPNEVFLVEGHTDAVGNDVDNLSLSDRRAETVASILTESFQIPPENSDHPGLRLPFPQDPDARCQPAEPAGDRAADHAAAQWREWIDQRPPLRGRPRGKFLAGTSVPAICIWTCRSRLAAGFARIIARAVRLGRILGMVAAAPLERAALSLAAGGDRLRGRLVARLDPLHQGVERGGEFRLALPEMPVFIREGLHQTVTAASAIDHGAIADCTSTTTADRDRMDRHHRHRQ